MRIKRDLCPNELAAAPHFLNLHAANETEVADAGEVSVTGAWLLPLIPRVGAVFGSHGKDGYVCTLNSYLSGNSLKQFECIFFCGTLIMHLWMNWGCGFFF